MTFVPLWGNIEAEEASALDKNRLLDMAAQSEEDRILLAKVYDKITAGERKNIPASTCFLTPREQILAKQVLRDVPVTFFGGTPEAERAVCCYVPEYLSEDDLFDPELCPIRAVRAEFFKEDTLTHRDFLGSLIGSGIKRETVGDIFVSQGSCDFFVTKEILPYVLQNLESAGRTKLHLKEIPLEDVAVPVQDMNEIRSTVSSLRLDAVVGAGFGLARGKAADAIEAGRASVNDLPCVKPDKPVSQGDKIALRGMGKIILETVGGRTKKDRIGIVIRRFG